MIPRDPSTNPVVPALLSLVVPGLGQVWLGQWVRGLGLFLASSALLFGLGLANLLTAHDAWSLARRLREEDIGVADSSKTLAWLRLLWWLASLPLKGIVAALDSLAEQPGPFSLILFPWYLFRNGIRK